MPILKCGSVRYWCEADELSFFRWIDGMKGVQRWWHEPRPRLTGDCLCIEINSKISQKTLRDLVGLFQRCKMNMKVLSVFHSATDAKWFTNPIQPWHERIFANSND